ncbi:MAG: peptide ABC transporter substrate-binding protein, partial [Alphaproteobacteria bacterium]
MTSMSTGAALSFEGTSLVAPDCSYGGKFSAIRATDEHTVSFAMCAADPAFEAKAAFIVFGIQPAE